MEPEVSLRLPSPETDAYSPISPIRFLQNPSQDNLAIFQVVFFFKVSRQKKICIFLQYSCHIPRPDHSPWFDNAKIFRERNKSWSSSVSNISPAHCHLLPLSHPILKQPCVMLLPKCEPPSIQLTYVKPDFLKTSWLKIQVFCDVTLSHWVSGWQVSKYRTAFAFGNKQSKRDGLFTYFLWRRRHHDPSTGLETPYPMTLCQNTCNFNHNVVYSSQRTCVCSYQ
jgi:hypothetical protein